MKRIITIIIQITFCILSINAQLYLKTFTGYSLSLNTDRNQSVEIVNDIRNEYGYTFKNGQGINLGIGIGYQINDNISVETNCNTQILSTQKIIIPSSIDYDSYLQSIYVSGFFGRLDYRSQFFQFTPQLMYRVNYQNIKLYIKTGPNFLWARSYISQYYKTFIKSQTHWGFDYKDTELKSYIDGKHSIGLQSSFGIEYPILPRINLFGELLSVISNYEFDKETLKSYKIEGVNQINETTQTTNYLDPVIKSNFSQIGLNIGIKYTFY